MCKLRVGLICLMIIFCLSLAGQDTSKVIIYKASKSYYRPQVILDLSYRNLRDLPPEASNIEIEILILDNNMIEKLPNRIGNLKKLKILSVRNNNLIDLNSVLSFCPQLEQIYLSGNKDLATLPNLSSCRNLAIIDVIGTKINEAPIWIDMMDNMFYFKYSDQ
jgi:hypothetical protein